MNNKITYGIHVGLGICSDPSIKHSASQKLKYPGLNADIIKYSFSKKGTNIALSIPFVFDALQDVVFVLKDQKGMSPSRFTSFFNGRFGKNFINSNKYSLGAGLALTDYAVFATYLDPSGSNYISTFTEPSGWQWTAGPALFLNIGDANKFFSLIASFDITYTTRSLGSSNEGSVTHEAGYPKPMFIQLNPKMNFKKIYFGIDYTRMIDNGSYGHKLSRKAFMIGLRLS